MAAMAKGAQKMDIDVPSASYIDRVSIELKIEGNA